MKRSLIVALALVVVGLVAGSAVVAHAGGGAGAGTGSPTLSVFQTELRFVMRLWQCGQRVKFLWHLAVLIGADN